MADSRDPQSFRQAVDGIDFAFNWAYIDTDHIAYQLSGAYPERSPGTSPDFPILGTGEYDWQGFDADLHTMSTVPLDRRPHAVDPPYLVSWNNKQAPRWAAADDKFSYGPVFRSQMIERRVRTAIKGPRKGALAELVGAMEEPASQDLRAWALMPALRRALGRPADPRLRDAIALLSRWASAGAHRRDLDGNGSYEDERAVQIMDAWWPRLIDAEFGPALGPGALEALKTVLRPASVLPGDDPAAPDYDDGWWGFVSKDVRDALIGRPTKRNRARARRAGIRVRHAWSRRYCGQGRLARCRTALQDSLRVALAVTPAQLYGTGDCASTPDAHCFDLNRAVIASGVDMPPAPFQNRPTFQQTVELTRRPPR